jgi:hypothetical protein
MGRPPPGSSVRRGASAAVVSLQHMAGNRAVARLVGGADDARIETDASLGGSWTEEDGTKTLSGRVGGVDRILLDGLSGHQGGKSWGEGAKARKGHAAATGPGKAGHRGRAVALVPHSMKRQGGPISIVVHLHGIDIGKYAGSSGMREQGDRPEDVQYFQIPQQLGAFSKRHPEARVVVLMPLGATVKAGGGFTVDFGVDNWDKFVDESLAKLGIAATGDPPGSVYMSAHSGGGFTISALAHEPFQKYRFGGVFAFESFHTSDIGTWTKLAERHLGEDLAQLTNLRKQAPPDQAGEKQLAYLRDKGFRFAAFGGFGGYGSRAGTLHAVIVKWLADNHPALEAAAGGNPAVLDLLSRNYQATPTGDRPLAPGQDRHMAALSQDSHFETALESLVAGAPAGSSHGGAGQPAPHPATTPAPKPRHKPADTHPAPHAPPHADHKQQAHEEHKGEHPPPATREPAQRAKPAVAKRAKPAKAKSRSLQEPFQFAAYPLLEKPIVLIPGDDEHSTKYTAAKATAEAKHKALPKPGFKPDITGIPSEFMVEILRRAKVPDPDAFFKKFVGDVSFLGRPINAPIHEHLAEHLRGVEHELAEQFGGPGKDPKVAGDTLGLGDEAHAGARQASGTAAISMHMFGLAIDVNHYRNPYLQAAGGIPQDVFLSISQLMQGKDDKIHLGASEEAAAAKYARLQAHNQMVIDYFALADPAKEQALKDKLAQASGPWKKRDVKEAREQIEKDLASLGYHTQRKSDLEMLRKHGYLQLREEVVRGMKMNWGAWYGDMMHFDMRTDGDIGQHISEQIVKYLGDLRDQQKAAAKAATKAATAAKAQP